MRTLLKQRALALWMIAVFVQSVAIAAEIGVDIKTPGSFTITVRGEIRAGDDLVFARLLKREGKLWVDLDSPGGDVDAALAIGRLVRKREGSVNVNGKCYSACVLIFAGGVTRLDLTGLFSGAEDPESKVGVHRLYFSELSPGLTQAQVKADYDAKLTKIRNYLREMDVAPEFVSYMQSIEPEQMHLMTSSELDRFGLGASDVVYNERTTARQAAELGLTSAQYREREQRVRAAPNGECKDPEVAPTTSEIAQAERMKVPVSAVVGADCALAIHYGISLDLYRERSAAVSERCKQHAVGSQQYADCETHFLAHGHSAP